MKRIPLSGGRWAAVVTLALTLLFVRPQFAFETFGRLDPQCYLAHLYRLLGETPLPCPSEAFLPGVALIWLPAAAVARALSALAGVPFHTPVVLSVALTALVCWALALWLATRFFTETLGSDARLRALLWVFSVPVLYYATSRPLLTHAPEFLLSLAAVHSLTRERFGLALAAGTALCFVRLQHPGVLVLIGAAAWDRRRLSGPWSYGLALGFSLVIGYLLYVGLYRGYNNVWLADLWRQATLSRLRHVLVGADWGLLWTAPWWLWIFVSQLRGPWRASTLAAWLWMASVLFLCVGWRGNGGDFGYRYLIGTYPAALWLWRERVRERGKAAAAEPFLIAASAAWTLWLTWIYRTHPFATPHTLSPRWPSFVPEFQLTAARWLADGEALLRPIRHSLPATTVCSWAPDLCPSGYVFHPHHQEILLWAATALTLGAGLALAWLLRRRSRGGKLGEGTAANAARGEVPAPGALGSTA